MGQRTPIGDKTVLVVEDEALLRFGIVDFFAERGWCVFEARNAEEAIALLARHGEIRVVLTDVQMPGDMDGLKLAHYVRERFTPDTPLRGLRGSAGQPRGASGPCDLPAQAVRSASGPEPDRTERGVPIPRA